MSHLVSETAIPIEQARWRTLACSEAPAKLPRFHQPAGQPAPFTFHGIGLSAGNPALRSTLAASSSTEQRTNPAVMHRGLGFASSLE